MVDVDRLSDAELRTKLIEFGYPVMPITGTTRKLMVKKLKLLLENKNKINNDNRRSLGRYSSEEESDTDVKSGKKDKNRRATMAAPTSTTSPSRSGVTLRKSLRNADKDDSEITRPPAAKDVVTKRTTTTTKVIKTVQDEFDTGSDSEPEIIEVDYDSPSKVSNSYESKKDSPIHSTFSPSSPFNRFQQQSTSKYSPPKTTLSSSSNISSSFSSSSFNNKPVSSSRMTSYSSTADNDPALDRLNQIRSRLSLGSTVYDHPTYTSSPVFDNVEEKAETPFLSNFTRRLSQLSANSPKPEYDFKNDIIKEHDTNGASSYTTRNYVGRTRYRDINRDYYPRHNSNIVKNNVVPIAVLVVACLFFLVLGAMYYGMRSSNDHAIDNVGIPRCSRSDPHLRPGVHCIHDEDIAGAMNLLKTIKPELIKRAVTFVCNNEPLLKPYMTEPDIINYQYKTTGQNVNTLQHDLRNLEMLIFKNPNWGISIIKTDQNTDPNEGNVLADMEEISQFPQPSNLFGLIVFHPDIPWRCTIYNKFHAIFNTLVVLFGAVVILYLGNFAYKYIKDYQQQRKQELFRMVEQIIDVLQSNTGNDNDNFLVINHVRDMILPITDRKCLEKTWEAAVKFINENESRVRTEVQVVQGEPFEVWRWLGNPNLNTSSSPRSKTWQGQAFETQVGSVNSLPCSPTPCLKIRGMADDDDDYDYHAIRDAVLNKCANKCRILHCAIDDSSRCVYLKCADQSDAAIAYTNLHGWWYAGHLVTVKYLRLERYMQRFPNSPVSGPPYLKALSSNNWST